MTVRRVILTISATLILLILGAAGVELDRSPRSRS